MADQQGTQMPIPAGVGASSGPAQSDFKPQGQVDVGLLDAFLNPLPNERSISNYGNDYNPDYKPTWGEELVSAVSPVTVLRHYGEAESMLKFRSIASPEDRKKLDALEYQATGKNVSDTDLIVKKYAAEAELALTVLPFFAPAKAAISGGKAVSAMEKFSGLFTKKGLIDLSMDAGKQAAMGGLYGGLYGLHSYDGDWQKAAESAGWGAALGVGGMGFMKSVQFALKGAGELVSPAVKKILGGMEWVGKKTKNIAEDALPTKAYATLFGGEAGFKQIAKKSGIEAADLSGGIRRIGTQIHNEVGQLEHDMIMVGGADLDRYAGKRVGTLEKTKKLLIESGVDYKSVGGNEARMRDFAEIVEGIGKYSDPKIQQEALKSHPLLQYVDTMRKANLDHGGKLGILDQTKLKSGTYMPRQTPVKEYNPKAIEKISKMAVSDQEAALEKMYGEEMASAVKYATEKRGLYKNTSEAWAEYNDFLKLKAGKETDKNNNLFLKGLVKRGDFDTIEGAANALKKDWQTEGKLGLTSRSSSLDFDRKVNLPWYDPNVARVFTRYGAESIERFAKAAEYGAADEKLYKIITKVRKQDLGMGVANNLANDLEGLVRSQFKTLTHSADLTKFVSLLKSSQLLKLSFSSLQNLTQTANTILAADMGSTLKGITHAFEDENILKLIKSGATSESFMRQAFEWNAGNSKFAEKFLEKTGFTRSEVINRAIASHTSDRWLEKNFDKLVKDYGVVRGVEQTGKSAAEKELISAADKGFKSGVDDIAKRILDEKPGSYWALKELGVDVEKAIKDGFISAEDKARAAYNFVEKTQFTGNALDLPYLASHPVGQIFMQFKTFAYQQSKLAMKSIADPIARKDPVRLMRNLLILNTVYPMSDAAVKNIRSVLTQEKAPDLLALETYTNNLFSAGNFGIMADFWNSVEQDRGPEFLIGASTNDIYEYLQAIQKTATLDPKARDSGLQDVAKQVLKQSGVGRIPLNMTSKQPGKSTLQKLGVFK